MREVKGEGDGEVELIDLNKEPVERKRKRIKSSDEKLIEEGSGCFSEFGGRVLRSRTVDVNDGEREVVEKGIIESDEGDECEVSVSRRSKRMKGRLGRPPKGEGKCGASSLNLRKKDDEAVSDEEKQLMIEWHEDVSEVDTRKRKGKLGRPPKGEGKGGASSWRISRNDEKAVIDGEKQVIESDEDASEVPTLVKRGKRKGKRGRPPKAEGKCGASSSSFRKNDDKAITGKRVTKRGIVEIGDENVSEVPVSLKRKKIKGRRGRPPKAEGNNEVSSLRLRKKGGKLMKQRKFHESNSETGRAAQQVKPRRGRPPKMETETSLMLVKRKGVKSKNDVDNTKNGNCASVNRVKPDTNDLRNSITGRDKGMIKSAEGNEVGLREQKQLVRDQIVSMIKKAGWTIEYRQRQSKDYQDAVYVDREGKTYWSVTKAYKKLKETVEQGKGSDADVSSFSLIPEETLSMLFRITEKGKKAGKKGKGDGKIIKNTATKDSSKGKSVNRRIKGKRRTLLARKPRDGPDGDGYNLYDGKRSLLSWMIDLGTVPLGSKVKYKRGKNKRATLEGRITKDGICCDCCNIIHAIQDFESHAQSALQKPYQNIYLDSGNPLSQCLVDSWKKHVEMDSIGFVRVDVDGEDPNDDTCNICGDGGDLICCDSCPSTFHHGCLRIKIPSGDWHCVYCQCKFCGVAAESTSMTDDNGNLLFTELSTCCLCEEKFHVSCIEEQDAEDFETKNPSFCGNECLEIFERLQDLLGARHELEEGFFYTVLKHHDVSSDAPLSVDSSTVESNSKLAVAFTVMDECFEPIIDERSGTNMIHKVFYSCRSNIRRLDYGGFFTIILEKGDEFVSAASIRIHGSQLAEMPFIGTRYMYRRQGMCSRLLTATERVLGSLGIEKLVIPAISELNETWTKVFGFSPLEESTQLAMKYMSMIVFPGVDMLQKPLLPHQLTKQQMDSTATECKQEKPTSHSNGTSSDVEIQTADPLDVPATEFIEVDCGQNTEKEQNEEMGSPDASVFDASPPELEVNNNDNVDSVDFEPGASLTVGSPNKASDTISREVTLEESSDNGNCLNESGLIIDVNASLEAKSAADCKFEVQKSSGESSTCLNNSLSVNGN